MKFYESGDQSKPVIFLFPGTCCLYSSFDHVLEGLQAYFYNENFWIRIGEINGTTSV